jgi:hypothetical protein
MKRPTEAALIAVQVRRRYPSAVAVHLGGDPPGDGTWYFKFHGRPGEAVLESPTGDYPFYIRAAEDESSDACEVANLLEAVAVIGKYLDFFREDALEYDTVNSTENASRPIEVR